MISEVRAEAEEIVDYPLSLLGTIPLCYTNIIVY
jgi:hypothetical protein